MENKTNNQDRRSVFAEQLVKAMELRQINQKELARLTNTTPQSISYYVNDARLPDADKLREIALALHVSADYLLGLSGTTSSDADDKKINQMLGLSEKAIECLKEEADWARCETNMDTNAAIRIFDKKYHMSINSVVNLLLEEPHRKDDDDILSLLGDIFTKGPKLLPLPKHMVVGDEYVSLFNDLLSNEGVLTVRLLNLQEAIRRYKNELDNKANGGNK